MNVQCCTVIYQRFYPMVYSAYQINALLKRVFVCALKVWCEVGGQQRGAQGPAALSMSNFLFEHVQLDLGQSLTHRKTKGMLFSMPFYPHRPDAASCTSTSCWTFSVDCIVHIWQTNMYKATEEISSVMSSTYPCKTHCLYCRLYCHCLKPSSTCWRLCDNTQSWQR